MMCPSYASEDVSLVATFMYIKYIYLSSDNLYCYVQNCVYCLLAMLEVGIVHLKKYVSCPVSNS